MSSFTELLNKPLPSKQSDYYTEGSNCVGCEEDVNDPTNHETSNEFMNNIYNQPTPENPENDEPDPLTPEQSQRVDDTINAVATPILIDSELTESEIDEFIESVDSDIAVSEGFLTEKTIVKFDKHAKKAQLYEVAVAACAREHKDPLFKKLETVYKMERVIKAKLRKKYNSEAQKKVKEYLARAKKSKSGILARIANKLTKK